MNDLISIIIPVYNVEDYLERCLNSVINQTYRNLEIILIDDGSTDNSGKFCDEYAKKDDRIKVIHKENSGVSSARNRGIEIAKGNYIGFVDSDDYIEKNMYEVLYNNLINYDVDISMCNYYIVKDNKKTLYKHKLKDGLLIESNKTFLELLRLNYYKGFLWNKLFKAEVLHKLKLCENIHICEDLLLIIQYSEYCKKFYFDNRCYYNYVIRKNSAIQGKINNKKISVIDAYKKIIPIVKEYGEEIVIKYEFDFCRWENNLINQLNEKYEQLKKENDILYNKIVNSKYITRKQKIELYFRCKMYVFYNCLRKIYHRIK